MTQNTARKPRRMAREPQAQHHHQPQDNSCTLRDDPAPASKATSRLDQLQTLLTRTAGATIDDMVAATGWQQHSVRGAIAGALKKRGLVVTSQKTDGTRRYHAAVRG
jgi:hypothetical protein